MGLQVGHVLVLSQMALDQSQKTVRGWHQPSRPARARHEMAKWDVPLGLVTMCVKSLGLTRIQARIQDFAQGGGRQLRRARRSAKRGPIATAYPGVKKIENAEKQ